MTRLDISDKVRRLAPGAKPQTRDIFLSEHANPKCRDCLGRGWRRFLVNDTTEMRLCHCVRHVPRKKLN